MIGRDIKFIIGTFNFIEIEECVITCIEKIIERNCEEMLKCLSRLVQLPSGTQIDPPV